ncbi:NAD(P)H-dependent oxidoreductase [Zobellia galactanivorans]|uniref:K+/H+ antiporter, ancillary protein KefF n=1 Tax=Zobellia galactanivorans (strain DSM 12802 / CCUG 47099 / CIP 106680 / NCIMB 13871 / Dsij) TaxID=63186 RepID=G0L3F4_ZOBGA|nr:MULTISPECIES: NAD(P)H-dependent oxidoreductase [Zobellia]MDO6808780.1 NAD(P)H-dependent oxidoreductase [Zobellia galactanivorans]OWW25752.1 NAD(P)H oxidoreductase [Zobellia sp. OII3]CAZ98390.1 K+/H+ antiporter, ancillary protein KefF [Zobellia galactanivorans]
MKNILVLFSHPKFEKSRANVILVDKIKDKEGVTFHDLYERYPDFNIDVDAEKALMSAHDIIIFHHPFYWYSCPPLMKQWIDVVLEFGWAYGPNGTALQSKKCLNVITTGGSRELYCSQGSNSYSVTEFLRPFEQTANLCGMQYLPPFAVMGTHRIPIEELHAYAEQYDRLLDVLQQNLKRADVRGFSFINDIPQLQTTDKI